ncbi:MAG: chemotaxis protein CheX [Actinomycetes bacterium]
MSTLDSPAILVTEDVVGSILDDVWESVVLAFDPMPLIPADVPADLLVHGGVSITGDWNGNVVVGTTLAGARALAAGMLMLDEADLAEADVADVLGELANMVGGNVKALLPTPHSLSLPFVVLQEGASPLLPHSVEAARVDRIWGQHPVSVVVHAAVPSTLTALAPEEER